MAGEYELNILLDSEFTYQQYAPPVTAPTTITNVSGDVINIVTTINGATGPITFTSPDGYVFSGGVGGVVTMTVDNPALARTALGAAASGVNTDITQLNGASQVDVSGEYKVSGTQVVTAQQAAIPDASGGVTIDTEARAAINSLLSALRTHGLIAT